MSNQSPFIVLPQISLRPEKIVFYNKIIKYSTNSDNNRTSKSNITKGVPTAPVVIKEKITSYNNHNFKISNKAGNRIREKVTWLYHLAKNQTITTHNGKVLYSFKMNFITLTLPSTQKHNSNILTNECLNQFITECKVKFGMNNYVWRLEFQKNGNAHYHIATDCYIEYWKCKKIWNRIINKLGYVNDYSAKFSKYTFQDYYKEFHKNGQEDYKILRGRFEMGVATKWLEPNTVDCRNVTSSKNISFYISKYITKNSDDSLHKIVTDREDSNSNLRMWFCSRSLSRLSSLVLNQEEYSMLFENVMNNLKEIQQYVYDYCSVFYYKIKEQSTIVKQSIMLLFRDYATQNGYFKPI